MKRKIIGIIGVPLAVLALVVGGVLLLPKEEEPQGLATPLGGGPEEREYIYVTRGDLEEWVQIDCRFQSLQQEHLSFQYDGREVGEIHVEVGDDVEPGDLLAELKNEALDKQLERAEDEAVRMRDELEFARKNLQIVRESAGLYDRIDDYKEIVKELEEDSRVADLRLEELREQKRSECIYAGIEGTVTHIRSYDKSNAGSDTIVVSDRGEACFYADTEYYDLLKPSEEVSLTMGDAQVTAIVTKAEDLGFEEQATDEKGKKRVYFVPKNKTDVMSGTDRANLRVLLDSRRDVLIIREAAVIYRGEQAYVYCEGEDGIPAVRPIELGKRLNGRCEVLSGLSEGEALVVG